MFVFQEHYEYDWPVIIEVPVTGGKHEDHEITARFQVIPIDEAEEILGRDAFASPPGREAIEEFLTRAVVGWEGVQSHDKKDWPFSDEALGKFIKIPYVRRALYAAYADSIAGRTEKN